MEFREWLKANMEKHGVHATALAEMIDENQPTLQRIITGETKNPRLKIIKKLEEFFKEQYAGEPSDLNTLSGYTAVNKTITRVPVVGRAMGGLPDRLFTDEGRPTNGHDEYAEVYSGDKLAFATKVEGNSMYPKYVHGDYALVEPGTDPELEDEVLLKLKSGEVMLKRLMSRRGGVHLASFNESQTYIFQPDEILWMYYVAYPIPLRKIKNRL
jgi:phage repressor protein C with HTH and peptisase S24 domain